ncbi:MAG: prolyl oligopeptidase family serine peptidase [Myxococcota bacterium]|jgi:alpha/beta superfamily hydrolase|nr:prolyl oligopeptidase family serine peptidase [Myxococcota bacterium]
MSRALILGLAGFGLFVIVGSTVAVFVFVRSLDEEEMRGFAQGVAEGVARGVGGEPIGADDPDRFANDRRALGPTTLPHVPVDRSLPQAPLTPHLELVRYAAPLGPQWAYATPVRTDARRPAVIYVVGGFDWGIGDVWTPQPIENDQSGAAFQREELVVMYPSLRGSHDNPGRNECFLGEVDDLLAAGDHLARRPDVDPGRIYLVGHSTGGTLAMLVAAARPRFAGIFAFGPHSNADYGDDDCFPEGLPELELKVRSPVDYVDVVRTPTWVIEGAVDGNTAGIDWMKEYVGDAPVHFLVVPELDHFSVLRPGTEVLAEAIVNGPIVDDPWTAETVRARWNALVDAAVIEHVTVGEPE